MRAPGRAIFLSYASQDAEAAQRICAALRAVGLDVWFDRSELRGGDAWEVSIRQQIKECALFVPVISANTQARKEGFFRREWNLAANRTLDMADDKPFLLPVVIDATLETNARVPEKFREVTWTHLPAGEAPAAFAERAMRLLPGGTASALPAVPAPVAPSAPPGVIAAAGAQPSIAVLPFANISGDPEQEYFSDGITEDIITELSRWRTLSVTSRNSTFRFKGKAVDVQRVARELGVRFLVEGSVRRMGERVRVTAQLIDAETGNHVWAERFDRPLADLFAVQDEVVQTIVATTAGRVRANVADRIRRKAPASMAAYDHVLRGHALPWDDPASLAEARRAFETAIEIDPGYGLAYSQLTMLLLWQSRADVVVSRAILDRAFALAKRGVELAADESTCHAALGEIHLQLRQFDHAMHHFERCLEINPNNQADRAHFGGVLARVGRAEEGLEMLKSVRRADPYFGPPWYWRAVGFCEFVLRRYADALSALERGVVSDTPLRLAVMAGCCAKLGQAERARDFVVRCLAIGPDATVEKLVAREPLKESRDREHFAECLRLAGVPE